MAGSWGGCGWQRGTGLGREVAVGRGGGEGLGPDSYLGLAAPSGGGKGGSWESQRDLPQRAAGPEGGKCPFPR